MLRRNSKRAVCVKMLLRPQGATREQLLAATGWPTISVQDIVSRTGMELIQRRTDHHFTYWLKQPRHLDRAINKMKSRRGLSVRVAKACGIRKAAVYQWTKVPSTRVMTVAPILGMTPEEIRPDIFCRNRNK
jgi:Protein of unknown function (DUF3489)